MPLNPEAVGSVGEAARGVVDLEGCAALRRRHRRGHRRAAVHDGEHQRCRSAGVPHLRRRRRLGRGSAMRTIGTFNPALLVHGQQAITLHKALPVNGSASMQGRVVAMYDKGKAAVVVTETVATDLADGQPMFTNVSSVFIRGEGGWGGDRGPSGPQNVPPERAPDHEVTYQTSPDQALVYRLSGDRNPLHSDPSFAAMGGFERPILHGLCTYGFTGRALLHTLCGSDASRFRHIEGRFTSPVVPGEALDGGDVGDRRWCAVFTTSVGDRVVIDQGLLRFD